MASLKDLDVCYKRSPEEAVHSKKVLLEQDTENTEEKTISDTTNIKI